MVGVKAQRRERAQHGWVLVKTVVITGVWVQSVGGGRRGTLEGGLRDSGRLARLNRTVWTWGSEEALRLLSRRGLDQIKDSPLDAVWNMDWRGGWIKERRASLRR